MKLLLLEDLLIKTKIDLILVIINRLLKYTMFILYLESTIVEQLVDIVI
jgi:hypothetical protein